MRAAKRARVPRWTLPRTSGRRRVASSIPSRPARSDGSSTVAVASTGSTGCSSRTPRSCRRSRERTRTSRRSPSPNGLPSASADRSQAPPAMPDVLTTGSVVAGYRIARLIGRGATGSVYLAEDAEGQQVALKVLIPELARNERFRERFLREARIAASLDEPHIVPTLATGEEGGVLYLVMRFVDGLDLREILKREGAAERRARRRPRRADRECPRCSARTRPRPPRRQAGQRPRAEGGNGRARLPLRLRSRQAPRLGREPHGGAGPRRHDRVHLPRADRGRADRRAGGRLLARLHALRVPHRPRRRSSARARSRRSMRT